MLRLYDYGGSHLQYIYNLVDLVLYQIRTQVRPHI